MNIIIECPLALGTTGTWEEEEIVVVKDAIGMMEEFSNQKCFDTMLILDRKTPHFIIQSGQIYT